MVPLAAFAAGIAAASCARVGHPVEPPCRYGAGRSVALGESLPEGGTAAARLATVAGVHQGPFEWFNRSPDLQITPPAGTTTFDMEIAGAADTARYFPAEKTDDDVMIACTGLLVIDSTIRFATADGGLAETWTAAINMSEGSEWGTAPDRSASFEIDLREQPARGTFTIAYVGAEPVETWSVRFGGHFDAAARAAGSIGFSASSSRGNVNSGFGTNIASWGAPAAAP